MKTTQVPISLSPFTRHKRVAQHLYFAIMPDQEMIQQVRVIHVDEAGVPIHEVIDADAALSDIQKAHAKGQYPVREITKQTSGAFCDPKTGAIVAHDYPGAITQLTFFQKITVEQMLNLTGKTPKSSFADVIYTMLAGGMLKIDARGEL